MKTAIQYFYVVTIMDSRAVANIDLVNLSDIYSDGLVTKAGKPMSTEGLPHFLADLTFGSDSVEKSVSTSAVQLHT